MKNEQSQNVFQIFRQGEDEILIASKARWDAHLRGLVELEMLCQSLRRNLRGIDGSGGAEGKRGFGARPKEAQVD